MTTTDRKIPEDRSHARGTTAPFDPAKLAQIGRALLGDQSIQEFCSERGLSRSLVSKLLNQSLSGPPTPRSICKFVGDGNEHLLNETLAACGHPPIPSELLEKLRGGAASDADGSADRLSTYGFHLLTGKLLESSFEGSFQVDFRSDGLFAIQAAPDNLKLVGIPAFRSSAQPSSSDDYEHALKQFARALGLWSPSESVYCILTDSTDLFNELIHIPNLAFDLMLLLTNDQQSFGGYRIPAQMADIERKEVPILEYIVDQKLDTSE